MSHRENVLRVMKVQGAPDVRVNVDLADMKRYRMAANDGKMRLFRLGPRMNEMLPVVGYLLVEIEALRRDIEELSKSAAKFGEPEAAPEIAKEVPVKRGPGRPRKTE
jgi:hypothetical protein